MMKYSKNDDVVVSNDGHYIEVNGQQYVSMDHILATQQWLDGEKQRNNNAKNTADMPAQHAA